MLGPTEKKKVRNRVARIAGQVDGIARMIDENRYCIEVLDQIAAARSALNRLAQVMLESHVDTCVAEAFANGSDEDRREKLTEVFDVFGRFGKL
jgi:DNA-binding FrmR family transcriptional regulator